MEENSDWKVKTLIVGVVTGALTGLLAAYILVNRAEHKGEKPQISPGEGVQLGLGVLGLLRLLTK
jgi:hypothetical protein